MDDSTIIKRCQAGQHGLFSVLVHRYKTPVYSFCLKPAGNEADAADLFQDTWLKAIKNIEWTGFILLKEITCPCSL